MQAKVMLDAVPKDKERQSVCFVRKITYRYLESFP